MGHQERDVDVSRRDLGALIGALAGGVGLAALASCTQEGSSTNGIPDEAVGRVASALSGGTVTQFDSITNLRASSPATQDACAVVENYNAQSAGSPPDGGGGIFWWSFDTTTADDGGTVIAKSSGRTGAWKRVYSGPLNVRWFGAQGNAIGDDAPAISAAVAVAASLGTSVWIPPGVYMQDSSIALPENTRLIGDNRASTILATGTAFPQTQSCQLGILGNNVEVAHVALVSPPYPAAIAAVATQGNIVSAWLHHLNITGGLGLQMRTQNQSCVIESIAFLGTIDQAMRIAGTVHVLRRIDTTGVTTQGSSSLPLIHVDGSVIETSGNTLEQMILEGAISTTQSPLTIESASMTVVRDTWIECDSPQTANGPPAGTGNGHWCEIYNSTNTYLEGYIEGIGGNSSHGPMVIYSRGGTASQPNIPTGPLGTVNLAQFYYVGTAASVVTFVDFGPLSGAYPAPLVVGGRSPRLAATNGALVAPTTTPWTAVLAVSYIPSLTGRIRMTAMVTMVNIGSSLVKWTIAVGHFVQGSYVSDGTVASGTAAAGQQAPLCFSISYDLLGTVFPLNQVQDISLLMLVDTNNAININVGNCRIELEEV